MRGLGFFKRTGIVGLTLLALAGGASAQVRTVDPSSAAARGAAGTPDQPYYGTEIAPGAADAVDETRMATAPATGRSAPSTGTTRPRPASDAGTTGVDRAIAQEAARPDPTSTFQDDDILGAAENVFGRGAEGLAKIIEDILRKQGRPNAYIGGREVGGSFVAGLRYGSGTLHHKIEGDRPIYWTGPSLGFDFGGNGAKTFVLVYNLYDSQDIYRRFGAVEGAAYLVGGFNVSYLRRGDVVLIPIRLGVGWRIGANVGYMKFSEKAKILPF